jgi:hypothetical protein
VKFLQPGQVPEVRIWAEQLRHKNTQVYRVISAAIFLQTRSFATNIPVLPSDAGHANLVGCQQGPCEYVSHYHMERNHQGKNNVILFPEPEDRIGEPTGDIHTRERLGDLLKFYHRRAA